MADHAPDPRTLNSWEDAFQHPLPVVRKLEQQLRKNIDDNRQKLRSLVGASYRDLLGTAERIIEMDEQMRAVETNLGDIGRKCNARTAEKIAENHKQIRKTENAKNGEKYGTMAQTRVLQSALTMVSRIVKAGGDALQASKLLVLARLLHKSVAESDQPPPVIEDLRRKLLALRKKLLSYIERALTKPSADKVLLAHTICAYALITSSTPKDVLRHFLQARYEQLEAKLDSPGVSGILEVLEIYSQTLLDVRELFPRRFADALSQLAKLPLLKDEQVQSIFELNLDVYESWIAEEVRAFIPWVRHDQLTNSEVADALEPWTRQAQECLLRGIQESLASWTDADAIIESRYKVISKSVALSAKLRSDTAPKAIRDLRAVYMARLEQLAEQAASIEDLTLQDPSNIEHLDANNSIWSMASHNIDLSNGALKFRRSLLQKRRGRDTSMQAEIDELDAWVNRINRLLDIADNMQSFKWDDDFEFDIDDLEDANSKQQALSKEDPDQLRRKLCDAVQQTLITIVTKIESSAASTEHGIYYLRLWRELDQRRRALEARIHVPFGTINLSVLHRNISQTVSKGVIEDYYQSVKNRSYVASTLWDGSPTLPVQPSPATFRFLTKLHRAMSEAGTDIWDVRCVFELKGVVLDELPRGLDDSAFTKGESETKLANGHTEVDHETLNNGPVNTSSVEQTEDQGRQRVLQNLFDVHYLRRIFYRPGYDRLDVGVLGGIVQTIKLDLDLDDESNDRLKKNASEYWKRSYLLFGLLASGGGELSG